MKWNHPRRLAAGHQAAPGLYAQAITGGHLRPRRAVEPPCQAQRREELWEVVPIFRCEAAAAEAAVAEAVAECCGESGRLCLTIVVDDDVFLPLRPPRWYWPWRVSCAEGRCRGGRVLLRPRKSGLDSVFPGHVAYRDCSCSPHLPVSLPAAGLPLA